MVCGIRKLGKQQQLAPGQRRLDAGIAAGKQIVQLAQRRRVHLKRADRGLRRADLLSQKATVNALDGHHVRATTNVA